MGCLMGVWRCRCWGGWICLAVGTASEGSSLLPEYKNTHTYTHTSRKEDGIYHLTTIEIATPKGNITRSILKRCKNIKLGSAFSSYWKHNSERMKINSPSISTNRAINWCHHYLTLATHASKRQLDQTRDRLERDTNIIRSQNKSCKSCQYKRHSQKCGITLTLCWL